MSSSASISAAKKRRANQPNMQPMPMQPMQPQMQRPISAPGAPGAIPLANLNPAQRQQYLQQQQVRMQQPQMLQQQMLQQQMLQQHQQQHQQQLQQQQQQQPQQPMQQQKQNPVNYNQQSQQPKLSWPAPPIYIMKQMDTLLFQQGQSIDEIKNRLNCIETGSSDVNTPSININNIENIKSDPEFINGIVDNIMANSNLSEIIEQIDVVQNENKELRDLLHAQQKTINEMNIMLLKLFSQVHNLVHEDQVKPVKPVEAAESSEAVEAVDESAEEAGEEVEGVEASTANVELEITDK